MEFQKTTNSLDTTSDDQDFFEKDRSLWSIRKKIAVLTKKLGLKHQCQDQF